MSWFALVKYRDKDDVKSIRTYKDGTFCSIDHKGTIIEKIEDPIIIKRVLRNVSF